jgi:hypothetical protein
LARARTQPLRAARHGCGAPVKQPSRHSSTPCLQREVRDLYKAAQRQESSTNDAFKDEQRSRRDSQWAEARGAVPAEVRGTEKGGEAGILRFEFPTAPKRNDSELEEISWDEFFEKFDERNLELVFQEKTADGEQSNFNKLVCPENDKASHSKASSSSSKISESSKKHKAA